MTFLKEAERPYGVKQGVLQGVTRVVANNPGRMTYYGTNTYLIEDEAEGLTVLDPGPDLPESVVALTQPGAASMVTCSGVGTTNVTLSDRGTKDSKVEDTGVNTTDVNPCISQICLQSTSAAARGLREIHNAGAINKPDHSKGLKTILKPGVGGTIMTRREGISWARPHNRFIEGIT